MTEMTVEAYVKRALAAEKKALGSGDSNDFVAAETALGDAATLMKRTAKQVVDASYHARRDKWSKRDVMVGGHPPTTINVLDEHGGFPAITKPGYGGSLLRGNTLWRAGGVLKGVTTGTLQTYDPKSFYQDNNDVTIAIYKVRGYRYPIAAWFDNKTGTRIA
jgi:hypothetical protein